MGAFSGFESSRGFDGAAWLGLQAMGRKREISDVWGVIALAGTAGLGVLYEAEGGDVTDVNCAEEVSANLCERLIPPEVRHQAENCYPLC